MDVESIIRPEVEFDSDEEDMSWSDEEEDERVDNMLRLISQGFNFKKEMFVGGRKPAELIGVPVNKGVNKEKEARGAKGKSTTRQPAASRRHNQADSSAVNINESVIESHITQALSAFENKLVDILVDKLRENNKLVVEGMKKWLLDNHIVEEAEVNISSSSRSREDNGNINFDAANRSEDVTGQNTVIETENPGGNRGGLGVSGGSRGGKEGGGSKECTEDLLESTVQEVASYYNSDVFMVSWDSVLFKIFYYSYIPLKISLRF